MTHVFNEHMPFFKGNLHTHTLDSDGAFPYDEIVAAYQEKGYDFLAITDHWRIHPGHWHKNMLVLPGIELDNMVGNLRTHIVGVVDDMDIAQNLSRENSAQEFIDYINGKGGISIVAHPGWSLMMPTELAALQNYTATEIYNGITEFPPFKNVRCDSSMIIDMAARMGQYLQLMAGDDTHASRGEMFSGYIMVQAEELTMPALFEAIRAGRFYASQGPEILSLDYDEKEIHVRISPARQIVAYSDCPLQGKEGRLVLGENVTEYTYRYRPHLGETGVRIEVLDHQGRKAWSNYIKMPL